AARWRGARRGAGTGADRRIGGAPARARPRPPCLGSRPGH
ncbi:MAG: hypothetical protein AVDCRST_MAG41-4216, partial [uncultured Corynebacteriales bacterium]